MQDRINEKFTLPNSGNIFAEITQLNNEMEKNQNKQDAMLAEIDSIRDKVKSMKETIDKLQKKKSDLTNMFYENYDDINEIINIINSKDNDTYFEAENVLQEIITIRKNIRDKKQEIDKELLRIEQLKQNVKNENNVFTNLKKSHTELIARSSQLLGFRITKVVNNEYTYYYLENVGPQNQYYCDMNRDNWMAKLVLQKTADNKYIIVDFINYSVPSNTSNKVQLGHILLKSALTDINHHVELYAKPRQGTWAQIYLKQIGFNHISNESEELVVDSTEFMKGTRTVPFGYCSFI
jgi:predicted RNase H-like nuclease (RuvC/YqgF family)